MGRILLFLSISLIMFISAYCYLDEQLYYGCRIVNGQCNCGYGYLSEYRYHSNEACKLALKGRQLDICSSQKPCYHNGSCIQISQEPGFRCYCLNTGYFGPRCEKSCLRTNNIRPPYECVVI